MSQLVSHTTTKAQVEDLTTGRLILDRDSEVAIEAAADNREREMRDIVDRRQQKYNQDRLVSDKKEDALAKMVIELDVLATAKASAEAANRHEAEAQERLGEVREEMAEAEAAMAEAVEYTDTLRMMTQRLVADITNRRKLQHEMDRALGELRRELNVASTHQRIILAAERDAADEVEKLYRHLKSRRALQDEQMSRRKAMAVAFTTGGGEGGKDLVAAAREKVEARQKRMRIAQAQQKGIQWTLDNLKNAHEKMHLAGASEQSEGAASGTGRSSSAPAGAGAAAAAAERRSSSASGSASGSAKLISKKVNMPFKTAEEVSRLTGAVDAEEVKALRTGTFAQYMQAIYAKTGVTDGPYVLRRLHHWVRTEKSVQGQSAAAQRRYEHLRREQLALSDELERTRAVTLLEGDYGLVDVDACSTMATEGGSVASSPTRSPTRMRGADGSSDELAMASDDLDEFGPSANTAQTDSQLNAVAAAKVRLEHVERLAEERTRRLLDAAASLSNLVDRVRLAAPTVAKEVRSQLSSRAPRVDVLGGDSGVLALDVDARSEGGEEVDEEAGEEDEGEEGDQIDEATAAYNVYVKQLPKKMTTCELLLSKVLDAVERAGPIDPAEVESLLHPACASTADVHTATTPSPSHRTRRPSTRSALLSFVGVRVATSSKSVGGSGSPVTPGTGGASLSGWGDGSPELRGSEGTAAGLGDAVAAVGSLALARRLTASVLPAQSPSHAQTPGSVRDSSRGAEAADDEEEATADEACVHSLAKKKLRRTATWNDSSGSTRPTMKRAASRPELGSGGVLDRLERKADSVNLLQKEAARKAAQERDKKRAPPTPGYLASKG